MGMLLFTMCAAFSEMERELIKERVKAGLAAAHSKGRKGGRPKALTADKLKTLKSLVQSEKFSVTKICAIVGISRSVYYRAVAEKSIGTPGPTSTILPAASTMIGPIIFWLTEFELARKSDVPTYFALMVWLPTVNFEVEKVATPLEEPRAHQMV